MQIDRQQNEMVIVTIMVGIICGVFGESIVSTQVTPTIPQAYFQKTPNAIWVWAKAIGSWKCYLLWGKCEYCNQ